MIFGKYVNRFYKKYWLYLVTGFVFLAIVDIAQIAIPVLVGNAVSIFSNQDSIEYFFNAPLFDPNGIGYFIMAFLGIAVVMFIGRMVWRLAIYKVGVLVDFDLRDQMFVHAEELSVTYYKKQKVGTVMSLFNNSLVSVKDCFMDGIVMMVDGFIMAPMVVVFMFLNNWVLALVSLVPLTIMMICCIVVDKGMTARYEDQLSAFERLSDYTQEAMSGYAVIKAFVKEAKNMLTFAKLNQANKDTNMAYLKYSVTLNMLIELLINSGFVLVAFIGVQVILNFETYDIGSLVEFIGLLDTAIWPFIALGQVIMIRARGKAGLNQVSEFLDAKKELVDTSSSDVVFKGEITFKNFQFQYPDGNASVLNNINLHIKAGQNIGIVGRTGSGKSTLVKTLLKIYNVREGTLFFDEHDICSLSSKTVRDNIGYVAQNAFLFSDLIEENIAFGDSDSRDDNRVKSAAEFACVSDSIERFKDGYKTLIGERGASLSGGQKQRVAMARAIYKDPAILILDDSVSAVDSETEKSILENVAKLRNGKTTLIVSSRVSVVEHLDGIIVLSEGKIVGFGTHSELMKTCKEYSRVVELQRLEKEEGLSYGQSR